MPTRPFSYLFGILSLFSAAAGQAYARDEISIKQTAPLTAHEVFRRSLSSSSGDIFLLPQRNNFLLEDYDFKPEALRASHIPADGKNPERVLPPHPLTMHGIAWDYDLHIPLVFFDPQQKWFKKGRYPKVAVQQDIVSTLADVLGTSAPERSQGRSLREALAFDPKKTEHTLSDAPVPKGKPKAILVIVQDMTGIAYLNAQKGQHPFIDSLLDRGAFFTNAQVANVDVETALGHAAVGTGAYPGHHGITANTMRHPGTWDVRAVYGAVLSETATSDSYPGILMAPTLADEWMHTRSNKPIVLSVANAARAAISMAGHGSLFTGNAKTYVGWAAGSSGENAGGYRTDTGFFQLPTSFAGKKVDPYVADLVKNSDGKWYGNALYKDNGKVDLSVTRATPAQVKFEADLISGALDELKIGADDETDLVFMNFKSTDYCGHLFGYESLECREVIQQADASIKQIVEKLAAATGDSYAVVLTADHGAAPLPELSGGVRLNGEQLQRDLNKAFDKIANGIDAIVSVTSSQIFLNEKELELNGFSKKDVVAFVRNYEGTMEAPYNALADEWIKKGKPRKSKFFLEVVTKDEIEKK